MDETDRLLHNYLAAVAALRDHTRRLWKLHPPARAADAEEYSRRVATEFGNPTCAFVQDLRKFALHRRLPVAQGTLHINIEGNVFDAAVKIDRDNLLRWDKWSSSARLFLESDDSPIRISSVAATYTAAVGRFNDWFGHAFVSAHLEEFDDLTQLEQERAQLLGRGRQ